ncbi:hypothetical protein [Jiulongibacter sp. NS-SX5]|uniref:hypothetical protein n=1 Tax=Jiulongibacter sp. NS-SX5 TaxID=3463854 RepID=UPI0040589986
MASKHDKMLRQLKEIELKAKAESQALLKENYPEFESLVSVGISLHGVEPKNMPKDSDEYLNSRNIYFKSYPFQDYDMVSMYSKSYEKKKP